jgi:hypothetical protein
MISLSQVPVFVQIHEPRQHYYVGVWEVKGTRSEFEMVHLKQTPAHCKYLTGKVLSFTCIVSWLVCKLQLQSSIVFILAAIICCST